MIPPKMAFTYLFVWIFLNHIDILLGYSLTITGNATPPFFTVTCTVHDAADLDDLVSIYKKKYPSFVTSFQQSVSKKCSVHKYPPKGYVSTCGEGTNDSESQIKKYSLKINQIKEGDKTVWWCSLKTASVVSNNFTLEGIGVSCDLCVGFSFILGFSIFSGVCIFLIVVKATPGDKNQKHRIRFLKVIGVFVFLFAITTSIFLAFYVKVDRNDGSWIAAVVMCALGFLYGCIFSTGFRKVEEQHEEALVT